MSPTTAQLRAARDVHKRWHVVRQHTENLPPFRMFVYVDDGVSIGGIDGITHEVSIRPDGEVLGVPDEDWEPPR